MRHFAIMIAALSGLTVLLAILGAVLYARQPTDQDTAQVRAASERIAPVAGVYAGDTGRAAMQAAQAAAVRAAASQVAYGGTTDGKTIYGQLCHSCHTAGVTGAPKLGDKADWAPRIAEGIATLIKHAEDGYKGPDGNQMPARGGNPALTDAQVEATVKWMVSQVQ